VPPNYTFFHSHSDQEEIDEIMENMVQEFEDGEVYSASREAHIGEIDWASHSAFQGVSLKHLVTATDTEGRFSAHLVRVAAGCEIGNHTHAAQYELHEVVGGTGKCHMDGREIVYTPGICVVIPEGVQHRVVAGDEDLYLFAKFVPSLL
jgi:quercetin dioxygenase-like cupin family protein